MLDRKSIYALNKKDKDAIVYTDANGHIIRLTRADFDTEADFLKWKAWSDEYYHAEEKGDHVYANHTRSLEELAEEAAYTEGPEVVIERRIEKSERERFTAETIIRIKGKVTEKQFRRLWMRYVDGLTEQEIARSEKVGQQRVSAFVLSAIRKIQNLFSSEGQKYR